MDLFMENIYLIILLTIFVYNFYFSFRRAHIFSYRGK